MDNVNILVIEDTPQERDRLVKVLTDNNYTVSGTASNFKEALRLFYQAIRFLIGNLLIRIAY